MRVLTLHPAAFEEACLRLARKAAPCRPALIVGILTGGGEVGRRMAPLFPQAQYLEVRLQRAGTQRKSSLTPLLRRLPLWACNLLRRLEARRTARKKGAERPVTLPPELADALSALPAGSTVLVADDAVDTGGTILSVVGAISRLAPGLTVRTAALTVTTPRPALNPDFALWRGDTLLRCPWAVDYKK